MQIDLGKGAAFAATGGRAFDKSLPAVVMLHGAGMDRTVWSLQARYLAHHGRAVLALDLPGHGKSAGPALGSIPEMADWLGKLLDKVGVAQAAMVGHSMGALIALDLAARRPEKVRALALLGVAERMPVHPDLQTAADRNEELAAELITSWGHGRRGHMGGHPAPGLWMAGGAIRLVDRSPDGVLAADLAACNAYGDARECAAAIRCPALFLLGAADRMTPPAKAKPLIDAVTGARVITLPTAGHMMMTEQPDAVTDALSSIV
ncbi:MAG TPA: alpha/beta hydrolase [Dongiaceae bacterium]